MQCWHRVICGDFFYRRPRPRTYGTRSNDPLQTHYLRAGTQRHSRQLANRWWPVGKFPPPPGKGKTRRAPSQILPSKPTQFKALARLLTFFFPSGMLLQQFRSVPNLTANHRGFRSIPIPLCFAEITCFAEMDAF